MYTEYSKIYHFADKWGTSNLFWARCYWKHGVIIPCWKSDLFYWKFCSEEHLNMEMQLKALIRLTSKTNDSNQNLLSRITYIWYVLWWAWLPIVLLTITETSRFTTITNKATIKSVKAWQLVGKKCNAILRLHETKCWQFQVKKTLHLF